MADLKQPPPRTTAPDLEILADQVTLRPSGYVEPLKQQKGDVDKERNLVEHMAKFRSSPLEYALSQTSCDILESTNTANLSTLSL